MMQLITKLGRYKSMYRVFDKLALAFHKDGFQQHV